MDEVCLINPFSAVLTRTGEGDGTVVLTVASNLCILIEFNKAREMASSSIIQRMDEHGGGVVVVDDGTSSPACILLSNVTTDAVLFCVVGSQQLRNVIAEVCGGAEEDAGMAVQPFGFRAAWVEVRPQGVALGKISDKTDAACRAHVSLGF